MWLKLDGKFVIEDMWNHPAERVEELRGLLRQGCAAFEDRRRRNFYEVGNDSRVFYIHICPNGKVLLLAVWSKESSQTQRHPEHAVAAMPAA